MSEITAFVNDAAEASVLSACLMDPENALAAAADVVKPEHFYREGHRLVFGTMLAMQARGLIVDVVTVTDELGRTGQLERVGGAPAVAAFRTAVSGDENTEVAVHAGIVLDRARLRAMDDALRAMRSEIKSGKSAAEIADRAERLVLDATAHGAGADRFKSVSVTPRFLERMFTAQDGYSTGWPDLDRTLGKIRPGRVYLIAARPSVGKSAFAHNLALHLAHDGVPVAIATLEMERDEVIERMLAIESCVDVLGLKEDQGQTEAFDPAHRRLEEAAARLNRLPIHIDDGLSFTPRALRAAARRWKREVGPKGVLILDYIQLMGDDTENENRQQEVASVSRALVRLARELSIPIIALSQLSRATESRADHRPTLSDLRESGALEQDAHAVVSLFRPERYAGAAVEGRNIVGLTEVNVLKNRAGRTGPVEMYFHGETCRFTTLAR
jgi:replicative DNA helicase